jgi:hypothetical protein
MLTMTTFHGGFRMTRLVDKMRWTAADLWRTDTPLTATGFIMLAALTIALAGLWIDPRTITGSPAWLKPAKFAVSIAIYTWTLAWIFTLLPEWRRVRRVVGWTTAVTLVLEIVVIDLQAWRGTTSHFNVGAPLDAALFGIMGLAIVVQTLTSIAVAVALWRQRFADRALGWALRLGVSITIVGALSGGLMTRPTQPQLAAARSTGRLVVAGAHTVGAPDGGVGVPGTNWSRDHGDLRVPHFLGLHAMQALPLVVLFGRRRLNDIARVRLLFTAAASSVSLFVILMWQALRGQSIVGPDSLTVAVLAAWVALTTVSAWMAVSRRQSLAAHASAY